MIVLDVEIEKGILGRNEVPQEGIAYCGGWRDFKGMGIACLCTYDTATHRTRVFLKPQFDEAREYLASDHTGGFNTRRFDSPLLAEHGIVIDQERHFDALEQIWLAQGLDPDRFNPQTHGGWGLDAVMQATFGLAKNGNGAMAPIWWQTGKRGQVVDYCCTDVWLEAKLIIHMLGGGIVRAAGKKDIQFAPALHIERPKPAAPAPTTSEAL